jgi:predicted HAD superfamily Cof-like phosphohydrolase
MIDDVRKFMEAADCTTDEFNVRQTALYIGLQLEEMAEKLEAVSPRAVMYANKRLGRLIHDIKEFSAEFKRSTYDYDIKLSDPKELLDADIDLMWVTIGSVLSQGADIHGAIAEVARSNASKMVDGKLLKDANGKVTKPAHFSPPDLTPFVK